MPLMEAISAAALNPCGSDDIALLGFGLPWALWRACMSDVAYDMADSVGFGMAKASKDRADVIDLESC